MTTSTIETPIPVVDLDHIEPTVFTADHPLANDPLVSLDDYNINCQPYTQRQNLVAKENPPIISAHITQNILLRKTVAEMLSLVNDALLQQNLKLYVKDGYRPIAVQREYWNYFINLARKQLKSDDEQSLISFAKRFCSDPTKFSPDDSTTWPLHSTGGAVDLTLMDTNTGQELLLEPREEDYGNMSITHYAEALPAQQLTDEWQEMRKNRRILYNTMINQGFTNNPNEWWHYDFGTPMYGAVKGDATFWYGYI